MKGLSGSNDSKQTTTVAPWLEEAAKKGIDYASRLGQQGYAAYRGPDVAALTPMQQAAMQSGADAAGAFGIAAPRNAMAGMPKPERFAGGVMGYSSAPMYDQAMKEWKKAAPGQYKAYMDMFMNPKTGAPPKWRPSAGLLSSEKKGEGGGSGGGGGYSPGKPGAPGTGSRSDDPYTFWNPGRNSR